MPSAIRRALSLATTIAVPIALSSLAFEYSTSAVLWSLIACSIALGALCWQLKGIGRQVALACATATLGLALLEGLLSVFAPFHYEGSMAFPYRYAREDADLGYAPRPSQSASSRLYRGSRLIYDVAYTTDAHGQRLAIPAPRESPRSSVLFWGGSFAFGEGLEDDATAASQLGTVTDGHYATHNLAFHGYGPHHMLAQLASRTEARALRATPSHGIYIAIENHIDRVAGLMYWDWFGPRYVLDSQGGVVREGNFHDDQCLPRSMVRASFRSHLLQRLYFQRPTRPTSTSDEALFVGVVDSARREFESRYPESEFHVVVWEATPRVADLLRSASLRVHTVADVLPGYDDPERRREFRIPGDVHPNGHANRLLAEYIEEKILRRRD